MNINFLEKLSNADAIAANEMEVRKVLLKELREYSDEVSTDNLGSIIFRKQGLDKNLKIMLCAHIDEVGFIVRSIRKDGQIIVMEVGRVKNEAKFLQIVRITTKNNKKIKGIINSKEKGGNIKESYIDIGATSDEEVYSLGIEIGDMVTYDTNFQKFDLDGNLIGKAFDDRLGCYVMGEVLKRLENIQHNNTVYCIGTSSEEVGIRGAKTATQKINPDVIFVLDVACFGDEFIRDNSNKRQIKEGIMLTNFDRTLVPNREMVNIVKDVAKNLQRKIQLDMFSSGGTDGGEAHKVFDGKPTVVTCLPVRYGHCAYSIANIKDIEDMIDIYVEIIKNFDINIYKKTIDFLGGEL